MSHGHILEKAGSATFLRVTKAASVGLLNMTASGDVSLTVTLEIPEETHYLLESSLVDVYLMETGDRYDTENGL